MKITLWKHIFNEIWPTFLASMFVSVFLILATRMLSITQMVVAQGVNAGQVLWMLVFLIPDIIALALPAACLIAVLVAFLRLSADSEIIALKASGVSLYQMLPPVVGLSFAAFLIALVISFVAVPWGNRSFRDLIFEMAQSQADLGIKERVFCKPFDKVVFFVKRFSSRDHSMEQVFVVDMREPEVTNTIFAQEARIFVHPKERVITLHFIDGTIFVSQQRRESDRIIRFSTYDLHIGLKDIMAALASRERAPMEMSSRELLEKIRRGAGGNPRYNKLVIKLLEKVSIPIAVFLMGVIGVPLGAQIRGRGRSAGIGLGLAIFMLYYFFLAGIMNICETGKMSPFIGVWIPDIFLSISSAYLIWRVANERPINLLERFSRRVRPS